MIIMGVILKKISLDVALPAESPLKKQLSDVIDQFLQKRRELISSHYLGSSSENAALFKALGAFLGVFASTVFVLTNTPQSTTPTVVYLLSAGLILCSLGCGIQITQRENAEEQRPLLPTQGSPSTDNNLAEPEGLTPLTAATIV